MFFIIITTCSPYAKDWLDIHSFFLVLFDLEKGFTLDVINNHFPVYLAIFGMVTNTQLILAQAIVGKTRRRAIFVPVETQALFFAFCCEN